jgi:hypothetical protein
MVSWIGSRLHRSDAMNGEVFRDRNPFRAHGARPHLSRLSGQLGRGFLFGVVELNWNACCRDLVAEDHCLA